MKFDNKNNNSSSTTQANWQRAFFVALSTQMSLAFFWSAACCLSLSVSLSPALAVVRFWSWPGNTEKAMRKAKAAQRQLLRVVSPFGDLSKQRARRRRLWSLWSRWSCCAGGRTIAHTAGSIDNSATIICRVYAKRVYAFEKKTLRKQWMYSSSNKWAIDLEYLKRVSFYLIDNFGFIDYFATIIWKVYAFRKATLKLQSIFTYPNMLSINLFY